MLQFLLRLVAVSLVLVQGDENGVFIESPQPSVSPLNSTTTFTCTARAGQVQELLWEVDGGQTSYDSYSAALRERGVVWSYEIQQDWILLQLNASATVGNNGTKIVCVAFTSDSTIMKTAVATLYVYDHPSAPMMLSLSALIPSQLTLFWSEPYSHPNITTSYVVSITQLDTQTWAIAGSSHSLTVQNTSVFIFKPDVQSCDEYVFTVTAVNEAGASAESTAVSGTLPTSPNMTTVSSSLSHSLSMMQDDTISCNISFQAATTCPDYPITNYTLHLHNTLTNITAHHILPSHTLAIQLDSSDGLEEDTVYNYHITAENRVDRADSQTREMITTDVSHVTVTLDCPSLNITCHLLPGSPARGCYVSLFPSPREQGEQGEPGGPGKGGTVMVPLYNSTPEARTVIKLTQQSPCYLLQVYDWEAGGSVGHIPIPLETTDMSSEQYCQLPEVGCSSTRKSSHSVVPLPIILASVMGGVALFGGISLLVGLGIFCHCRTGQSAAKKDNSRYVCQDHRHLNSSSSTYPNSPPPLPPPPLPPFPPHPPIYDLPFSLTHREEEDSEEYRVRYSTLIRGSPPSSPHTAYDPDYMYSTPQQDAEYDEVNSQHNNHTNNVMITSLENERQYEFINSLPSAGTTI